MILDIIFGIIVLGAFYNGYKKGIIYSVLSFVAILLGLLLAINFSSLAGVWLSQNFNIPSVLLPVLAFLSVLILVVLSIKLVAVVMEKILKTISLNFINQFAGGLVWGGIATLLFSVVISLLNQMNIFTPSFQESSAVIIYVAPLGPTVLDFISSLIPFFGESFKILSETVKHLSTEATQ